MLRKLKYAVLLKCPHCRQQDMFAKRWKIPYWDFGIMHKTCPNCSQLFIPEPGFYFGASMISYGIGVFTIGITFVLSYWLGIRNTIPQILCVAAAIIFIAPFNFKFSRAFWLSWFVKPR